MSWITWLPHWRITNGTGNGFHSPFISFLLFLFYPRASERRVLPIVGVCKTSSPLHIFPSSHPHIFTSSYLHIFTSSHPRIFTSSHLHILTSSHPSSSHPHIPHLHILTSSHPSSSHPHIFTSSHLHIFTSSHLTSSHLHILTSSHPLIFTSSHLHSCSSSHLHIFSSSHLHILTSSPLALLPSHSSHPHIFTSSPLALLPSPSFRFLSWRSGAVPTRRHETQPFRTKWGSIAKNCGKIAIFQVVRRNPFARNEVRSPKTVKLRFPGSRATLSHEMRLS